MTAKKLTAKSQTPGARAIGGYRCGVCGAYFKDRRMPGDTSNYAWRNRSRGDLIAHWNFKHHKDAAT